MPPLLPYRPLGEQGTRSRQTLLLTSAPRSSPGRTGGAAMCGTFLYARCVQRLERSLAGKATSPCPFTRGPEHSLLPVSVGVWRSEAGARGAVFGHSAHAF